MPQKFFQEYVYPTTMKYLAYFFVWFPAHLKILKSKLFPHILHSQLIQTVKICFNHSFTKIPPRSTIALISVLVLSNSESLHQALLSRATQSSNITYLPFFSLSSLVSSSSMSPAPTTLLKQLTLSAHLWIAVSDFEVTFLGASFSVVLPQ